MCGIAGYYNLDGNHPPNANMMITWALLATRGMHAAGALWRLSSMKALRYSKHVGPSYDHALRVWSSIELAANDLRWVALHARHASVGGVGNPNNNHPVNYGTVWLTHNGGIAGHDYVFKQLGVPRHAEVDSEAIAACLSVGGLPKVLELCDGKMSLAWVDVRRPDTLHLYTNGGSPLWVSVVPKEYFVYASSDVLVPKDLHGIGGDIPAGVHITVRSDGTIRHQMVGLGKYRPVNTAKGWYYDCYDVHCATKNKHQHARPAYTFDWHNAHETPTKAVVITPPYRGGFPPGQNLHGAQRPAGMPYCGCMLCTKERTSRVQTIVQEPLHSKACSCSTCVRTRWQGGP